MLTIYQSGHSVLHRLPAGAKLIALLLISTGVMFIHQPFWLGVLLLLALGLFAMAGLRWQVLAEQLKLLIGVLLLFALVQGLFSGPSAALLVVLRLCVLYLLAMLLSWTTRTRELILALSKALHPLAFFGLPVERLALLASMTIRFIPMLLADYQQLAEARRARGGRVRTLPLLVPLLVNSLKKADALAEAIDARGFERIDRDTNQS